MEVRAKSPYRAIMLLSPVAIFLIALSTFGVFLKMSTGLITGLLSPSTVGIFGSGLEGFGVDGFGEEGFGPGVFPPPPPPGLFGEPPL